MPTMFMNRNLSNSFDSFKFVGYKIQLYPTSDQEKIFSSYFGACRFIYNYCIDQQEKHYQESKEKGEKYTHLKYYHFSELIVKLRKTDGYEWLNKYDLESLRYVSRDVLRSYNNFTDGICNKPKYHSKKNYSQSFPVRSDRLSVMNDRVRLPSIGYVNIGKVYDENIIGSGDKNAKNLPYKEYISARVKYDGYKYYLCFLMAKSEYILPKSEEKYNNDIYTHRHYSNIIGIDIGCSYNNWIVTSNGKRYSLPKCELEERKIKMFQSRYLHKLKINDKERPNPSYRTNNEKKVLKQINKYYKRIKNRSMNALYLAAHDIISDKPSAIVLEDLQVQDFIIKRNQVKWKASNIAIFNHQIYKHMPDVVAEKISQIAKIADIPVIIADRNYKSTQICSNCGNINPAIGSKKTYRCPVCGCVIDRDENAAINLSNFVYNYLAKPFVIVANA